MAQHPLVNVANQASRAAGRILLRNINKITDGGLSVSQREAVTKRACLEAEQELIQQIQRLYPKHAIASPNQAITSDTSNSSWVIEPISGYQNYLHGIPHYAISMTCQQGNNETIALIHDPLRDETFSAVQGQGAMMNQRRIRINPNCKTLDSALIGTGFPVNNQAHLEHFIKVFSHLFPLTCGMRRSGCCALDLAYVACGRLDGYWEMDLPDYDVSAGALIIQEAGGITSDLSGKQPFTGQGSLITAHAKLHKKITAEIAGALQG